LVTVYLHTKGSTTRVERIEPEWLNPASGAMLWVDLVSPSAEEGRVILADTFHFHPLSIEDALSEIHYPKVEPYNGYLYMILHGISLEDRSHQFTTRDTDFFLGPNYLVSVHGGGSRSIAKVKGLCEQHAHVLAEGPAALLHRIVDSMVDNYRPEIDAFEEEMDRLEDEAILGERPDLVRHILSLKRGLAWFRRVIIPQRDAIGRLARREFPQINDEMTYRFRDVFDHLVRMSDEATLFQDRITGILEAHLSTVSNRLNQVMKVLTVMSTIFLPLTVLTGMWGMNIPLPKFAGTEAAQFWWLGAIMLAIAAVMLAIFHRKRWI
jgi:magnesium transporter